VHPYLAFRAVVAGHADGIASAIRTCSNAMAAARVEADRQNAAHEQSRALAEASGEPVRVDPADEDLVIGILRARLIELGVTPDALEAFAAFAQAVALEGNPERAEVGPLEHVRLCNVRHDAEIARRAQAEIDAKERAVREAAERRAEEMDLWQRDIDERELKAQGAKRDFDSSWTSDQRLSAARDMHHVWPQVAAFIKRFGERPRLDDPQEPCHTHMVPGLPIHRMIKNSNGTSFR